MGRNFRAQLTKITVLTILSILFIKTVVSYQIEIPNYDILRSQKILDQNYEFTHTDLSLKHINKAHQESKMMLQNEFKAPVLDFEIFIYPYRLYSYLDEVNRKQYLMKKVDFDEFNQITQKEDLNEEFYPKDKKSILNSEFNLKQCLFKPSETDWLKSKQVICVLPSPQKTQPKPCFDQSDLYSLLPDLLMIVQEQHQMLEVQKVNDQHLLIKNYANQDSQHVLTYFLNLDLYTVNIHSFIYEARITLMKYLFEQKMKSVSSDQSVSQTQSNTNQQQTGQTVEPQNELQSQDTFDIKMSQFFATQKDIWKTLYQKNTAIFTNLFFHQTTFDISKNTKFDYLSTANTFYMAEVNQLECPISSHNIKFKLFSEKSSDQDQNQIKDQCTYLRIHKVHFIQFQIPQPIEYVSQKSLFNNVQMISLGLMQHNQSQNSYSRGGDLMIHIQTQKSNIQIIYGRAWKEIKSEDRPTNLVRNDDGQIPIAKVFFLAEDKVQVVNDTVQIYKQSQNMISRFEKKCELKIEPFILTVEKINNGLFSVCAQGSHCMILDRQCQKVNEISLSNALGLQWGYKINYLKDKVLAYITLSRRSDQLYVALEAPIDQSQLKSSELNSGVFHDNFEFSEVQEGLYKVTQKIISSKISYNQTQEQFQIIPTFVSTNLPYKYRPKELFMDSTYQSLPEFKEKFLDYILRGKLQQKFNKFYFPDLPNVQTSKPLQLLNVNNKTDFNKFFEGCAFDNDKNIIFQKDWKGCKIVLKTSSLMLSEGVQIPVDQNNPASPLIFIQPVNEPKNSTDQQSKPQEQDKEVLEISTENVQRQLYQIFANSGIGKNLLIVCSAHKNSPAYSKCKVTEFDITENFHDWSRKSKFFLEGGKYFQLYFFNQQFLTESNEESFLELLQRLARQEFSKKSLKETQATKKDEGSPKASQLKSYKIIYPKPQLKPLYYIALIDYEKQQLQGIFKILLITVCILFPALTICCCVVFFKSYFENILIYYGVMNAQPSFRYPLNNLALKIKMKELISNKFVSLHKNTLAHQKGDELSSNSEIKYSAECCFCLEQLKMTEEVAELYCKHEFHSNCFIEWVKNEPNTKCPLCKRAFTKTALNQFNSRSSITNSPSRPVQQFSEENQNENTDELSNQIEIVEFQS